MSNKKNPLFDVNLYDLLGISLEADVSEIRKAYRKQALSCHPDKNPDDIKAVERFHELSKALEILTDISARAAYDKVLKAKKAAELRTKQLDSKRQKLKADLEERERAAGVNLYTNKKSDEEVLQEQILRLRTEGSRLLEEEQQAMREQLKRNYVEPQLVPSSPAFDSTQHRIKIKWKSNQATDYTQEQLLKYLKKYGEVVGLVVNSKKPGRAMVELKTREACDMVLAYEKGDPANPLHFEWVKPPSSDTVEEQKHNVSASARDYENLVMRKLRQAEERKRLIEQMMKDDE
ncbi:dnaJ homolog subfamily C member 17 [Drosophila tropicalis]|uniref:dnaJ homolog subfamily C member 17 n=1 Tax=Drosophila tropicalis TaxID=46794 RepID=UPI0035ABAEE1